MKRPRDSVSVRVPGSTSNCGAGFDTLGLALGIWNRVTIGRDSGGSGGSGRPARKAAGRARDLVASAARVFFGATGLAPSGFTYRIDGGIPAARGLGSSATVVVGVLAGLNALHGTGLSRRALAGLATAVEGHPDNASASILGGFCVSRCDPDTGAYVDTIRFRVPSGLVFVTASPGFELLTKESRGALPAKLPYFDAVRSINSTAYFVAAFATGNHAGLRKAAGDFMHEPYRLPRIPGAGPAIAAGIAAGAHTGWLSGSGPSVLCVCARENGRPVKKAMLGAFAKAGVKATGLILGADNRGLVLERTKR